MVILTDKSTYELSHLGLSFHSHSDEKPWGISKATWNSDVQSWKNIGCAP